MKSLLLSALALVSAMQAQTIDNYTVKMSVKTEGLPAEYASFGELEMVSYVKGDKTKTETSSMMFSSVVYFDGAKITNLSESMGNKTGYTATKEEIDGLDKNKNETKPKIEYVNDKRTIAGYECSKAVITSIDKEQKEQQTIVWFTEKLKPANNTVRKASRRGMGNDLSELKGLPLAVEGTMKMQGMEVKTIMTATDISTSNIDDSIFIPNTEGYNMLSFKAYQEKMRMMGGGSR